MTMKLASAQRNPAVVRSIVRIAGGALFALLVCLDVAHAVDVGAVAPDFKLPTLGVMGPIQLSSLRGKIVLVDFWASWCAPCREAMPQYEKLYYQARRDDFEIIAVNLDEERDDAVKFLAVHPVTFPIALDPAGTVPPTFGVVGMPSSYLIDREGVVRLRYQGFKAKDLKALREQIHKLSGPPAHAQ
jgi:thiol-disulfide isomerase/thioredoxin